MRFKHLSYQVFIVCLVCFVCLITTQTFATEIFIDPSETYLTGSIGEEFQVELKVDGNTLGLRLFQVFIKFDSSLLDTVSTELGPLFNNSGFSTFVNTKLVYDSTTNDSVLKVEGLLLGASSVVDGPGTVAILKFNTNDVGVADLSILSHILTDINNDTIPSTSIGGIAYINTQPDAFNLLSPNTAEIISKFPGESIELVWEPSSSVYPGENIIYELEYSPDNTFPVSNTIIVSSLTDTTYNLLVGGLENGYIFWRVRAIGDINSYVTTSLPDPSYFDFIFNTQEPNEFNLISPAAQRLENLIGDDNILFDWEDAVPGSPGDIIEYTFYIGSSQVFPSTPIIEIQTGTSSNIAVASISLPICDEVFWTVEATNQHGLSQWANSVNSITFIYRGDLNCSGGGTNAVDISDLVAIVDFIFTNGPPPASEQTGNLDCSSPEITDISDLVFLVDFIFTNGPMPSCDFD